MITFALTTLATVTAGTRPCEHCDAEMSGCEMGDGVYLVEIRHAPDCSTVLPVYIKDQP